VSYFNIKNEKISSFFQIQAAIITEIREIPYDHIEQPQFANSFMIIAKVEDYHQELRITHYKKDEITLNINDLIDMTANEASTLVVKKVQKFHRLMNLIDQKD